MISFQARIDKFGKQGEKTGWTICIVPATEAEKLKPGIKKSFRVKGYIDDHPIAQVALIPIGGGDFIIPLNAGMRKAIRKNVGATVSVRIEVDSTEILPPPELIECLKDDPAAWVQFNSLAPSHRLYFIKWISSAKTEATIAKRMAQTVSALAAGKDYGTMLRTLKAKDREG